MSMKQGSEEIMAPSQAQSIVEAVNQALGGGSATSPAPENTGAPAALMYKVLNQTHPCYDAGWWRRLRALYAGGKRLLRDEALLRDIFPRHRNEHEEVYRERVKRAFYIAYAGEIIDALVASLTNAPLVTEIGDEQPQPELPTFWAEFVDDVTRPSRQKYSLHQHMRDSITEALVVGCAWTRADLPRASGVPAATRTDQEKEGALRAYLCRVPAECVLDWDEDDDGELLMAVVHQREQRRTDISQSRSMVTERWLYLRPATWDVYEVTYDASQPPQPEQLILRAGGGIHPFGCVPLHRLELPEGLQAMEKLEGLAREIFNKRSALGWAETQSLLPELYEFLGPELPGGGVPFPSEAQQDPGRAKGQPRGQGFVQERGKDDRAEYVGPPSDSFKQAMDSCNSLRDEMHRVTHQMALSVDNSAAALGRSADSKEKDRVATGIVLGDLGRRVRKAACELLDLVAMGRGEKDMVGEFRARGLDKFDEGSVDATIAQATQLATISIPSPTFMRLYTFQLAKAALGTNATQADLDVIQDELEEAIPLEPIEMDEGEQVIEDDDLEQVSESSTTETPPAPGRPGAKEIYSTSRKKMKPEKPKAPAKGAK